MDNLIASPAASMLFPAKRGFSALTVIISGQPDTNCWMRQGFMLRSAEKNGRRDSEGRGDPPESRL